MNNAIDRYRKILEGSFNARKAPPGNFPPFSGRQIRALKLYNAVRDAEQDAGYHYPTPGTPKWPTNALYEAAIARLAEARAALAAFKAEEA